MTGLKSKTGRKTKGGGHTNLPASSVLQPYKLPSRYLGASSPLITGCAAECPTLSHKLSHSGPMARSEKSEFPQSFQSEGMDKRHTLASCRVRQSPKHR